MGRIFFFILYSREPHLNIASDVTTVASSNTVKPAERWGVYCSVGGNNGYLISCGQRPP